MQRQVPSIGRILTMVIFVLSCFGLLLFLWMTFGGPVPFKPHGYRFNVYFPEVNQLTEESDVRISGVSAGKVKNVRLVKDRVQVTIEMEGGYAPVPRDTKAILRAKTLLSEAYVELTPGMAGSGKVKDGGRLASSQVGENVQVNQILSTFDSKTREALQLWLNDMAVAVGDRGWDLNDAIGNLAPFSEDLNELVEILERDRQALKLMVSNGGKVFDALSRREGQLRSLITSSNAVFSATAERDAALAQAVDLLPDFLDQSARTLESAQRFARLSDPLLDDLQPVARNLKPVLDDTRKLTPSLRRLFVGLGPLIDASKEGLPGIDKLLDEARPLTAQLYPFMLEVGPLVQWLAQYQRETAAAFANLAAASQGTNQIGSESQHLLRVMTPLNADSFAPYSSRSSTNRANAYPQPGSFDKLGNPALDVFDSRNCTGAALPTVAATNPARLKENMDSLIFSLGPSGAPACNLQPDFVFQGSTRRFPHVTADANELSSSGK